MFTATKKTITTVFAFTLALSMMPINALAVCPANQALIQILETGKLDARQQLNVKNTLLNAGRLLLKNYKIAYENAAYANAAAEHNFNVLWNKKIALEEEIERRIKEFGYGYDPITLKMQKNLYDTENLLKQAGPTKVNMRIDFDKAQRNFIELQTVLQMYERELVDLLATINKNQNEIDVLSAQKICMVPAVNSAINPSTILATPGTIPGLTQPNPAANPAAMLANPGITPGLIQPNPAANPATMLANPGIIPGLIQPNPVIANPGPILANPPKL